MNDVKHNELMQLGADYAQSIRAEVAALECDYERLDKLQGEDQDQLFTEEREELKRLLAVAGECTSPDDAHARIFCGAAGVELRGGWHTPGERKDEPVEFKITLAGGGPAARIIGDLDEGRASSPRLEVQDWGQPWTEYWEEGFDRVLDAYVGCFYFGE